MRLLLAALACAVPALACSCRGIGSVCDAIESSADVIVVEALASGAEDSFEKIPVRVLKVLKGEAPAEARIMVHAGPPESCGGPMKRAVRYILTRRKGENQFFYGGNTCSLGWGVSSRWDFASLIRATEAGAKPTLLGFVLPLDPKGDLSGIQVAAECGGVKGKTTIGEYPMFRIPEMAVGECKLSLERESKPVAFTIWGKAEVRRSCGFAWLRLDEK